MGSYLLFNGLFKDSFDNLYKEIKIVYANGSDTYYGENASVLKIMPQGSLMFMYISFVDLNNNEITACYPVYKNRDGGTYYTNLTAWRSEAFKHLTILEDNTNYNGGVFSNFDNSRTALSTFNIGNTGVLTPNNDTNIFTLFTSAFSSLTSLFAIQIFPNISLGLLFFLPLVVGIIIAIIWIVKR